MTEPIQHSDSRADERATDRHTDRETDDGAEAVRHDAAEERFVIELDGQRALAAYHREGDTVHFTHTEVPVEHEGRGVGSRLARAALGWARDERLGVVPRCPFFAAYMRRHRTTLDMVPAEWRTLVDA